MTTSLTKCMADYRASLKPESWWRAEIDKNFPGFFAHVASLNREVKSLLGSSYDFSVVNFHGDTGSNYATFNLDLRFGSSLSGETTTRVLFSPGNKPTLRLSPYDTYFTDVEKTKDRVTRDLFNKIKDYEIATSHMTRKG